MRTATAAAVAATDRSADPSRSWTRATRALDVDNGAVRAGATESVLRQIAAHVAAAAVPAPPLADADAGSEAAAAHPTAVSRPEPMRSLPEPSQPTSSLFASFGSLRSSAGGFSVGEFQQLFAVTTAIFALLLAQGHVRTQSARWTSLLFGSLLERPG